MAVELDVVFAQIDAAVARGTDLVQTSQYDDLSDHPDEVLLEVRLLCEAAIARLVPIGSSYAASAKVAVERHDGVLPGTAIRELMGILRAVRTGYENGYMNQLQELVHADVFSDFLEMADELVAKGYKDPAGVLAGSVLEEHLRKPAEKSGVASTKPDGSSRKASDLNADLTKAGVYNKLEQKNVTAWLGLRNEAAHGHYDGYDSAQVGGLVRDVRTFLARHPA